MTRDDAMFASGRSLFSGDDRQIVELYVRTRVGQIPEAVHNLLLAYDALCGGLENLVLLNTADGLNEETLDRALECVMAPRSTPDGNTHGVCLKHGYRCADV